MLCNNPKFLVRADFAYNQSYNSFKKNINKISAFFVCQRLRVETECHIDLDNHYKVFAINLKLYLIVSDIQSYASLDLLSL